MEVFEAIDVMAKKFGSRMRAAGAVDFEISESARVGVIGGEEVVGDRFDGCGTGGGKEQVISGAFGGDGSAEEDGIFFAVEGGGS